MQVFSFWKDTPEKEFSDSTLKGGSISLENNPALLGVGYIIGPYIAGIMMGGGVLSYLVLIPMIKYFGAGLATPLAPELAKTIDSMSPGQIRGAYILYIGGGCGGNGRDDFTGKIFTDHLARFKRRSGGFTRRRVWKRTVRLCRAPIRIFR